MFNDLSIVGFIFIPAVFVISRKILREKKSFLWLLSFSLLVSLVAISETISEENTSPNFLFYWFCPLYSLLVYRLMLIPFWSYKKRDPKIPQRELFYSGNVDLLADRLFGFVFMLLSVLIPMILINKFS